MLTVIMSYFFKIKSNKQQGFTLIEILIGAVILSIVCFGVYGGFVSVIKVVRSARVKTDAMLLANEQIEIARNLPYQQVGIILGAPVGPIPREQNLTRGGFSFKLTTSIRNIDDPFDGTMNSTTQHDSAGEDYKQMQIDIECLDCGVGVFSPQSIFTTIAPKNLETSTGNGALFVNVFNSNGDPVSQANVLIENSPMSVNEVTDNNGVFQLIGILPAELAYEIAITKEGYSSESTYEISVQNPNPFVPLATVSAGKVTQISFAIDKLSHLGVKVIDNICSPVSGVPVQIVGQKKIGQTPDIYKYNQILTSDSAGLIDLPDLEWDTYRFSLATTSSWFLAGSSSFIPLLVSPDSEVQISLTATAKNPSGLLVAVHDSVTGLPLSGAEVIINSQTLTTSQGFFNQTDWSEGSGQVLFSNEKKFADSDGNIDFTSTPGEIKLRYSLGYYLPVGDIVSSIFDTGATSTEYDSVRFSPVDQATSTGVGSVRLQLASGNDSATTTWNFLGPDGTNSSYYLISNETINPIHNGDRYIRYKVFLQTADNLVTPNISDVGLTFKTTCTPPGQAYFQGLSTGLQEISVTRSGYTPYLSDMEINDVWQEYNIFLEPI